MNRARAVLGAFTVAIGAAAFSVAWRSSSRAMHPPTATYAWSLDDYSGLRPEDVTVESSTGTRLAGRFFPGRSGATIIITHGYGGTQDELLPVANALHEGGFSVFTYDLRGCGSSDGAVAFGALEQQDLRSVVDYLTRRSDVDAAKIGALGFSMGAATTILAAADDRRIEAVVDDSGWSDVYHWLRPDFGRMLRRPRDQFSPLSLRLVELREGIALRKLRPKDVVGRIGPRPILIIQGDADDVVPPADSRENFAAAAEPKELWFVDGAAHGDTVLAGGPTSSDRVVEFFRRALGV